MAKSIYCGIVILCDRLFIFGNVSLKKLQIFFAHLANGTGGQLGANSGLSPEQVKKILLTKAGDYEPPARQQADKGLALKQKKPLSHRGHAHVKGFSDGIDTKKLPRLQLTGDNVLP